tara:strand:+ start:39 stop:278 length:240 start_codon:yes stop_codon:yes gene_type:complete
MSNLSTYKKAFVEALSTESSLDFDNLKYQSVDEWDSIGHMTLISNLEEKFKITFETDDIVDFSSFKKGIKILQKYKVKI